MLNGSPAHLSDLRGKVVLLNFWATWCPPCVDEAPALNELQTRISPMGERFSALAWMTTRTPTTIS